MNTGITALAAGRLAGVLLHAAVGIAFCDALHAQPAGRAIRLVVPFGPGGGHHALSDDKEHVVFALALRVI